MYLGFYKLKEMPFRLAPDPRFMYWSAGHAAAREYLRTAQAIPAGCAVITGDRGAGKTVLLEFLRQQAMPGTTVRLDFPPRTLAELSERVHEGGETRSAGAARMILCDNAHLFHESMLAAILRRESVDPEQSVVSSVILSGEPALLRTLQAPELASLVERHGDRFDLPPLTAAEVPAYITHRLRIAGAGGKRIFSEQICAEVHRETKGVPRLVNALCDAAMILGCERELSEVGSAEIRRALEDVGRLVALQKTESLAIIAHDPPVEASYATNAAVFSRLRLMHFERLILERDLSRGRLSIGRSADNDLCIDSKFVSRYHCRIVTSERKCILEDVHSTNGLYVNERRVRNHHMCDGDVVQIGEHRLHYVNLRIRPNGV